jgi:hypothetical protein
MGRVHLGGSDVDGKIILKCFFKEMGYEGMD